MTRDDQRRFADIYYRLGEAKGMLEHQATPEFLATTSIKLTLNYIEESRDMAVNAIMYDLKYGDKKS